MNGVSPVVIFLIAFMAGYVAYCVLMEIITAFNYSRWRRGAKPNFDATVVEIYSVLGSLSVWNLKFKTTVVFSDGFSYTTYKVDREDKFNWHRHTYTVSVDGGSIACDAQEAHRVALEKLLLKGVPVLPQIPKTQVTPSNAAPAQGPADWVCTCGRKNASYVSTCNCGVNKRDVPKE